MDKPTGITYGMTRASTEKQGGSPEVQTYSIRDWCKLQTWPEPKMLDETLGTSGTIKFRHRKMGRWILLNLKEKDALIVTDIDRLGRNAVDIMDTAERLRKMGVKLIVLQFMGMDLDISTEMGYLVLMIFAWGAQHEHRRIADRTSRAIKRKKELGLLIHKTGFGRTKIKDPNGGAHWEWDIDQLKIIAEIADRRGRGEACMSILRDLWRRGIKDHRGKPWGKVEHTGVGKQNTSETDWVYRAVRWFHRKKHKGELPPPWGELASLIPEGKRFTPEKKSRKKRDKPVAIDPRVNWTAEQWRDFYKLECPDFTPPVSVACIASG